MKAISILLASCLLAACTSKSSEPELTGAAQFADNPALGEEVDRICFASSIDGFSSTTRDTIIVREGRDSYLVEVFNGCFQLKDVQRLGIDATGGCLGRGDFLVVSDSFFADTQPGPERCRVQAIYKWDPKAEKDRPDGEANDS